MEDHAHQNGDGMTRYAISEEVRGGVKVGDKAERCPSVQWVLNEALLHPENFRVVDGANFSASPPRPIPAIQAAK